VRRCRIAENSIAATPTITLVRGIRSIRSARSRLARSTGRASPAIAAITRGRRRLTRG
jgi:hypothetical protein